MTLYLNSYALVLAGATCISLLVAIVAWTRRSQFPGWLYFALMMICIVIWSAASAIEAGAIERTVRIIVSKLGYTGIVGVAPLFLLFSFAYGRKEIRLNFLAQLLL